MQQTPKDFPNQTHPLNPQNNISKLEQDMNMTMTSTAPLQICKFEELKGEFCVRREIGRGKLLNFK